MNGDKERVVIGCHNFYKLMIATGFFRYNLEEYGLKFSEALEYQAVIKGLGWIT